MSRLPKFFNSHALLWIALLLVGCAGLELDPPQNSAVLRLATTTSTRDSGLLDELLPVFEEANQCRVDVIAVGTGAALELGKAGDADVLIVHAREAEEEFMAAGHGTRHEEFMSNHFAIVGPPDDPAKIEGLDASDALHRIADGEYRFVSRGDDSGTHKRELQLWNANGDRPHWNEYLEVGQGMGPTLFMTDEMQGYTLTDSGTYLKLKAKLDLVPLVTEGAELLNPYSVIVVNAKQYQHMNPRLAETLVDYLISLAAQRLIGEYRVAGETLFVPTRLSKE